MKYFNSHQFGLLDMISENNIIVNQLMRAEFVRLVWLNQKKSISCPNLLLCCDGGLSSSFNSTLFTSNSEYVLVMLSL